MCCNERHGHHHGRHRHHGCGCGESCDCENGGQCNCGDGEFERRYQTKAEKIAELEKYLGALKAEVQAVEEQLADLHK